MSKGMMKKDKPNLIDPSTLDQDAYMRFGQAINSMT